MAKRKSGSVKKLGGLAMELCRMFGLFGDDPKVGVDSKVPLAIGPKGEIIEASPTLDNLITHFGLLNEFNEFIDKIISLDEIISIPSWLSTAARNHMKRKFQSECLEILRKRLEDSSLVEFFFYCISPQQCIKNEVSGEIEMISEEERPLVPLPVSPSWCESQGFSETKTLNLGYQVGWLCWNLTRMCIIQKSDDLLQTFGPWLYYLAIEEPVFYPILQEKLNKTLGILPETSLLDSNKIASLKATKDQKKLTASKKKKQLSDKN